MIDRIAVQAAPTSNVQTKAVPDLATHPLNRVRDAGVRVTDNCDSRTVSGTTPRQERQLVEQNSHWAESDWARAQENAWAARF